MSEHGITPVTSDICGGVGSQTLKRMVKEDGFPAPKIIGRSHYYDLRDVYQWLSKTAGREINTSDRLLSSKTLQAMFKRSPTWVWLHFQKNKDRKSKAVFLRTRPYWLESEIYADKELVRYLEVAGKVAI